VAGDACATSFHPIVVSGMYHDICVGRIFRPKNMCVTPSAVYQSRRYLYALNIEAVNEAEQNPLLYKRILREFMDTAQMVSVIDRMDMW
jgi:hypothetical protein